MATTQKQKWSCAIAVMAKASQPGRTKTRLVPPLSYQQAAELNTSFLQDAIANIVAATHFAPVRPGIAYAPSGSEQFFRDLLPAKVELLESAAAQFGETLFSAVCGFLDAGHDAVCLLNADTPDLPTPFLVDAALSLQLAGDRVVLGPALDGGYYLIGLKRRHRGLFAEIDWSTNRVFNQTLDRAAALGLGVSQLPPWEDVDDAASLSRLSARLLAGMNTGVNTGVNTPGRFEAPNTLRQLQAWLNRGGEAAQSQAAVTLEVTAAPPQ